MMRVPCTRTYFRPTLATCLSPITGRIPALRRAALATAPLRLFSKLLIVSLLLVSPLSFSTDRIPNFTPECEVSASTRKTELRKARMVVLDRAEAVYTAVTTVSYTTASHAYPVVQYYQFPYHNRAPPLC